MSNKYIWTNHALKRLTERKISRRLIDYALHAPDQIIHKADKAIELQRKIDGKTIAAIIKTNERGEKIVISCWVNPPYPGTRDHKKRQRYFAMQKASPLKRIWLTLLNSLGL